MTVIRKNEVLEQMGRLGMKNRVHVQLIYISLPCGWALCVSVVNGRKLFDSFTRAVVSVSCRTKVADLSNEEEMKRKKKE